MIDERHMMTKRMTTICLVAAALVSLVGTLLVSDDGYNTFALILELLLLALALLAFTGRWWALGIAGLLSGLLGVYTSIGVGGSLETYEAGQILFASLFVASTLGAAVSGLVGAVRQIRGPGTVGASTP